MRLINIWGLSGRMITIGLRSYFLVIRFLAPVPIRVRAVEQ